MLVRSFDFTSMLAVLTGSDKEDWTECDGPESRVGLDYWYERADGQIVNINVDQACISFSGDLFEGSIEYNLEEIEDHPGHSDSWLLDHVDTQDPGATP